MAQKLMARVAAVDGTKVVMEVVMGLVSTVAVKLIISSCSSSSSVTGQGLAN